MVDGELRIIEDLGILSQFRGTHSTGIAVAGTKGKKTYYNVHKRVMDSSGVIYSKEYGEFLKKSKGISAFIGHCRHATQGEITQENAHPYIIGNIIGAHNGTIREYEPAKNETCTDSFKFYEAIAKDGIEKAVEKIEDGAYALTWFDTETNRLHILRNSRRPLYFLRSSSILYWASERDFLQFVMARHNNMLGTIEAVPDNTLISFDISDWRKETRRAVRHKEKDWTNNTSRRVPRYSNAPWEDYINFETGEVEEEKPPVQQLFLPTNGASGASSTKSAAQSALTFIQGEKEEEKAIPLPFLPSTEKRNFGTSGSELRPAIVTKYGDENAILHYSSVFSPEYMKSTNNILPKKIKAFTSKANDPGKILRYGVMLNEKPHYITPELAVKKLQSGCIFSKKIATIFDHIMWINDDEYVEYEFAEDPFLQEYATTEPVAGGLFYVPQRLLMKQYQNLKDTSPNV